MPSADYAMDGVYEENAEAIFFCSTIITMTDNDAMLLWPFRCLFCLHWLATL